MKRKNKKKAVNWVLFGCTALTIVGCVYNIDVYRNGKAVITTKIQNIESDSENNMLIIHGTSKYKTE